MKPSSLSLERLEPRHALSSPQIMSPAIFRTKEDKPTSAVVRITDRSCDQITVRLEVSSGALTHSTNNKVATSTNDRTIAAQGSKRDVNNLLKSVQYHPEKDSNKTETMMITASDGKKTSTKSVKIRIKPVNDAPTIEASQFASMDGANLKDASMSVADPDSKQIRVSITTQNGTLNSKDPLATNLGNGLVLKGSPSEINRFLSNPKSIELQPADRMDFAINIRATDGWIGTTKTIAVSQKESLEEHATKQVESRLQGKDPTSSKNIFSLMDHNSAKYERNPQGWAQDLDLSPISPWNSAGANRLAGTLVSPKHIVYATHYQMPIGAKIRFVTGNNQVVERTLTGKISPSVIQNTYFPDITVGVLDSDVPEAIGFAKILPTNWQQHLNPNGFRVPCLALDQEEKALVSDLFHLSRSAVFTYPNRQKSREFSESIVAGDSGNPAFMVVDKQLVLITIWTFGDAGSGTFITNQKDEINRAMAELGGGYQLQEIDLGGFRKI